MFKLGRTDSPGQLFVRVNATSCLLQLGGSLVLWAWGPAIAQASPHTQMEATQVGASCRESRLIPAAVDSSDSLCAVFMLPAPSLSGVSNSLESSGTLPSAPAAGSVASPPPEAPTPPPELDLDPQIIQESPVLQRWLEAVPDVAHEIKHTPAFRTRARLGYSEFPSADGTGGIIVGIQDVFVGQTPLTLSAEYTGNGRGDREGISVDAKYYLLPLGGYVNVAPIVGYQYLELDNFISDGLQVGVQVMVIPSRSGAADLSLTQVWIAPGTDHEVGQTTLSVGYAVTHQFRLASDIQLLGSPDGPDSRVSLLIEWLL